MPCLLEEVLTPREELQLWLSDALSQIIKPGMLPCVYEQAEGLGLKLAFSASAQRKVQSKKRNVHLCCAGRTDPEIDQLCSSMLHVLASLKAAAVAAAAPGPQLPDSAAVSPMLPAAVQSSPLSLDAVQHAALEARCACLVLLWPLLSVQYDLHDM